MHTVIQAFTCRNTGIHYLPNETYTNDDESRIEYLTRLGYIEPANEVEIIEDLDAEDVGDAE